MPYGVICTATKYICGPFDTQYEAEKWKRYSNRTYKECNGHTVINWKDRPGG